MSSLNANHFFTDPNKSAYPQTAGNVIPFGLQFKQKMFDPGLNNSSNDYTVSQGQSPTCTLKGSIDACVDPDIDG